MSEPKKSSNGRPGGKGQPERFQPKVILIWLAIFSVMAVLWYQTDKSGNQNKIDIYDVVLATEEGLIESGRIFPNLNGGSDFYDVIGMIQERDDTAPDGYRLVPFKAYGRL